MRRERIRTGEANSGDGDVEDEMDREREGRLDGDQAKGAFDVGSRDGSRDEERGVVAVARAEMILVMVAGRSGRLVVIVGVAVMMALLAVVDMAHAVVEEVRQFRRLGDRGRGHEAQGQEDRGRFEHGVLLYHELALDYFAEKKAAGGGYSSVMNFSSGW